MRILRISPTDICSFISTFRPTNRRIRRIIDAITVVNTHVFTVQYKNFKATIKPAIFFCNSSSFKGDHKLGQYWLAMHYVIIVFVFSETALQSRKNIAGVTVP